MLLQANLGVLNPPVWKELVSKRRGPSLVELLGNNCCHEGVGHASVGTMRHNVAARMARPLS